jgi:hypothetical protein
MPLWCPPFNCVGFCHWSWTGVVVALRNSRSGASASNGKIHAGRSAPRAAAAHSQDNYGGLRESGAGSKLMYYPVKNILQSRAPKRTQSDVHFNLRDDTGRQASQIRRQGANNEGGAAPLLQESGRKCDGNKLTKKASLAMFSRANTCSTASTRASCRACPVGFCVAASLLSPDSAIVDPRSWCAGAIPAALTNCAAATGAPMHRRCVVVVRRAGAGWRVGGVRVRGGTEIEDTPARNWGRIASRQPASAPAQPRGRPTTTKNAARKQTPNQQVLVRTMVARVQTQAGG